MALRSVFLRGARRPRQGVMICFAAEPLEARRLLAVIVWDGGPAGTGTSFSDPVNWVGDVKPGPADDAVINTAGPNISLNVSESVGSLSSARTISQSGGTLTLGGASNSAGYVLTNGALAGAGNLTITGALTWSGGIIGGSGKLIVTTTATLNGSSTKALNRSLDNAGTLAYTGTGLTLATAGATAVVISNLSGASFNISAAGGIGVTTAAAHVFSNAGTLTKTGVGTTSTFSGLSFDNTGSTVVTSGTLAIASGSSSGTISVSAGTVLAMSGTRSHTAGTLSGAGTLQLSGTQSFSAGTINHTGTATLASGTHTFNGGNSLGTVNLSSATVQGNGELTITKALTWTAGSMGGTGKTVVAAGATASVPVSFSSRQLARTLDVAGVLTQTGSAGNPNNIAFGSAVTGLPGVVNVLAGGSYTLGGGPSGLTVDTVLAGNAFNVFGTLTKADGSTTGFDMPVGLHGGVNINDAAGRIRLLGGGSATTATLGGAGRLRISGGTVTGSAGGLISGGGTIEMDGGTLASHANVAGIVMSAGGIGGFANVTVSSSLVWSGGNMTGTGTTVLAAGASGSIPVTFSPRQLSRVFEVAGSVMQTGSAGNPNSIALGSAATGLPGVMNVLAGATYTMTGGPSGFTVDAAVAGNAINVAGTLVKNDASVSSFAVPVMMNGTTNISNGTVQLLQPGTHTGLFQIGAAGQLHLGLAHVFAGARTRGAGMLRVVDTLDVLVGTGVTLEVGSVLFGSAASRLNLADNDLLVNYTGTSPVAALVASYVQGQITMLESFGGLATQAGISEAADLGLTTFNQLPLDETAVVVKFTYVGDGNLDGKVDALDYERVDLAIGNTGVSGTAQGDLNYDGRVDALDYEQVDLNIGNGVGMPLGITTRHGTPDEKQHSFLFLGRMVGVGKHHFNVATLVAVVDSAHEAEQVE